MINTWQEFLLVFFVMVGASVFSAWLATIPAKLKTYNTGKFEIEYWNTYGEDVAHVMAFTVPDRGHLISFGDGNTYEVLSVVHKYPIHRGLDPEATVHIEITLGDPK